MRFLERATWAIPCFLGTVINVMMIYLITQISINQNVSILLFCISGSAALYCGFTGIQILIDK